MKSKNRKSREMTPEQFHKKFPEVDGINVHCTVDYACPKCGSRGPFYVEVSARVELSDEDGYSTPDELQETFKPNTECCRCCHVGGGFIIHGLDEFLSRLSEQSEAVA